MKDTRRCKVVLVSVVLVVNEKKELLLLRHGKLPNQELWSLPGGKVNRGETLQVAAIRETKEETGLDVTVKIVTAVGNLVNHDGIKYDLYYFKSVTKSGRVKDPDGYEILELKWFSEEEVYKAELRYPDMIKAYEGVMSTQQ
jgi:8-oxo-dGTP diphosphatase